ncbi:MAG: hypothetical protein Tsb0018_11120 [Opitutales bacterium]
MLANDAKLIAKHLAVEAAQQENIFLDDTHHRIQTAEPKKIRGKHRTGVYCSGLIGATGDRKIALFKTNIGHAGEFLDEILRLREKDLPKPIVMCDALSSNRVTDEPYTLSLCNVHSRREFKQLEEQEPDVIQHLMKLYGQIFANEGHCKQEKLDKVSRQQYHHSHSLPLLNEIKSYAGELIHTEKRFEENSNFAKAYRYLCRHWEGLTAFCFVPGAPLDNNLMENTLRIVVLGRKNAYFYRTEAGAAIGDVLTSILATCKLNDINPFHYLKAVQRYKDKVKDNVAAWLPWNYHEQIL